MQVKTKELIIGENLEIEIDEAKSINKNRFRI